MRTDGSALPNAVGANGDNGVRLSDGSGGHLCYGPYFSLEPGNYIAGFYIRRIGRPTPGTMDMDIFARDVGQLAHRRIASAELFEDIASLISLPLDAKQPLDHIEVRLYVSEGVMVEVRELVVFSTRPRDWNAK
jgi:hypothetical protein